MSWESIQQWWRYINVEHQICLGSLSKTVKTFQPKIEWWRKNSKYGKKMLLYLYLSIPYVSGTYAFLYLVFLGVGFISFVQTVQFKFNITFIRVQKCTEINKLAFKTEKKMLEHKREWRSLPLFLSTYAVSELSLGCHPSISLNFTLSVGEMSKSSIMSNCLPVSGELQL